jgi:hypothetical protein
MLIAPVSQVNMTPSSDLTMIASSDELIIAANSWEGILLPSGKLV